MNSLERTSLSVLYAAIMQLTTTAMHQQFWLVPLEI